MRGYAFPMRTINILRDTDEDGKCTKRSIIKQDVVLKY